MSKRAFLWYLVLGFFAALSSLLAQSASAQTCPLNGTLSNKLVCQIPQVYGAFGFGTTSDPTQSVLLQGSGPRNIVVIAMGYSPASVIQTIAGVTRPTLGGVSLTGGALTFSFTSSPGLSFSVVATNNLTAPIASWPVVGTATEGPAGHYQFTDPNAATNPQTYYAVRQP